MILFLCFIPRIRATEFHAKTVLIDTQQQHLERQKHLNRPHIALPVKIAPSNAQCPGRENPCFIIHRIWLEIPAHYLAPYLAQQPYNKNRWLKKQWPWLIRAANRYIGQCVGSQGVTAIVHHLSHLLLLHGFITSSIGIPNQDMSSGTLRLTVLPGFISTLRFVSHQTEIRKIQSRRWQTLFPTCVGRLFNLRDLEQGLEQMSRVPHQVVELKILPAQQAGGSEVIVTTRQTTLLHWRKTLGTTYTNSLQINTGITLILSHPLDLHDVAQISYCYLPYLQPLQGRQHALYLDYSVPYRYWTFNLLASIMTDRQAIFKQKSNIWQCRCIRQWALNVDRVLYRDQRRRFSLQGRLGQYYQDTAICHKPIAVQKRRNTFVEFGFHYRQVLQATQLNLVWTLRRGMPWLGAMCDLTTNAPNSPTFFYQRQTLDAMVAMPIQWGDHNIRYSSLLRLQQSHQRLYDTEKCAIGGHYTVRGFSEQQQLTAENGLYWRNELEFPLCWHEIPALLISKPSMLNKLFKQTYLFIGLDYGQLYDAKLNHGPCQRLLGSVLGLRGKLYKQLNYETTVSWPLYQPKSLNRHAPIFTLQFDYHY